MVITKPALNEFAFFAGMTDAYLDQLSDCASPVTFAPGRILFYEGDAAEKFYLIVSGLVSLDTFLPGKGPVQIQTLDGGEILGWSWLYEPYHWHFTARTLDTVQAIAFDAAGVRRLSEADDALGYELLKRFTRVIISRLQAARIQLLDVYGR